MASERTYHVWGWSKTEIKKLRPLALQIDAGLMTVGDAVRSGRVILGHRRSLSAIKSKLLMLRKEILDARNIETA